MMIMTWNFNNISLKIYQHNFTTYHNVIMKLAPEDTEALTAGCKFLYLFLIQRRI